MSVYLFDMGEMFDGLGIVKVGYSHDPQARARGLRTRWPNIRLVKSWEGDEYAESCVHISLRTRFRSSLREEGFGRPAPWEVVGSKELYLVRSVEAVVEEMERILGQLPPPVAICVECVPPRLFVSKSRLNSHLYSSYPHRGPLHWLPE